MPWENFHLDHLFLLTECEGLLLSYREGNSYSRGRMRIRIPVFLFLVFSWFYGVSWMYVTLALSSLGVSGSELSRHLLFLILEVLITVPLVL